MGEFKDNHKEESVKKLKELVESIGTCMFCTQLSQVPISARPMHANQVSDDGNIWFLSNAKSNKNFEIKQDEHVQLFFSKMSDNEYLSVYGKANIYTDRASIEEHWTPIAKAWFDGKDDPDVSVIRVEPEYGYYWDTKDGKAVAFLKWAAAAMGAKIDDGGIEGRIRV